MGEQHTCPQRMGRLMPHESGSDPDTWDNDRWTMDHEAAERKRQEFRDRNPRGSISANADEWLWSWGPPRTCSFCGSIHPEDAIQLVEEGWEIEPCDGKAKCYLNPPGTRQRREAAMRHMPPDFSKVPSVWSPVPPVKAYGCHFTPEQIERFNAPRAQG